MAKSKQHHYPAKRRQKSKPKPKPSTALVVRTPSLVVRDPNRMLPAPELALNTLGEEATLGALGLVEVKLTAAEEMVLSSPVDTSQVLMKPTGQPYLSHPTYTRWFNQAFGRLGWAIVPRSKPMRTEKSVVCPYVLYIHGQPAAFAMGEQEYFENNREQTYGDALEATVASALRRCAKRLGVGLELWDKRWLNRFIAEHCIRVKVTNKDGSFKNLWRRRDDPPLPFEAGRSRPQEHQAQETEYYEPNIPPQIFRDHTTKPSRPSPEKPKPEIPRGASVGQAISDKQRARLFVIMKKSGRDEKQFRDWLWKRYQIDSTKKISRANYDEIVAFVESPAPLMARIPGEDDA